MSYGPTSIALSWSLTATANGDYCRMAVGVQQSDADDGDLLPELSSFIGRICSGYAPDVGVLRTRSV